MGTCPGHRDSGSLTPSPAHQPPVSQGLGGARGAPAGGPDRMALQSCQRPSPEASQARGHSEPPVSQEKSPPAIHSVGAGCSRQGP